MIGSVRVVTGPGHSIPSGTTDGAIRVYGAPDGTPIPDDLPAGTVFVEYIDGPHADGLLEGRPAQPIPAGTTSREHFGGSVDSTRVADVLRSPAVLPITNAAIAELVHVGVTGGLPDVIDLVRNNAPYQTEQMLLVLLMQYVDQETDR